MEQQRNNILFLFLYELIRSNHAKIQSIISQLLLDY